jgi:choice-of-anchor B domain-containing protein
MKQFYKMMNWKKMSATVLGVAFYTLTMGQLNLVELGNLDYQNLHNSDLSDVWGYVDENSNEYALVGVNDGGFSIVDVTNPANPVEVFFESGPNSIWRDIKTFGDYAYVTTEGGGGLLIVDMGPLPGSTNLPTYTYNYASGPVDNRAHNLYIDTDNGLCFIFGADNGNEGTHILDLNGDPTAPVELGTYDPSYVHDGVTKGDTLYACHILDGYFAIVDISNPASPQVLGTKNTPSDFAHNAWISDDGNTLYTTDERPGAFIAAYDVSDPTDITELDRIQSNPGSQVIPHNTHFINNYLVTSYYRDGVTVHDVADPSNMIEVGNYDSSPLSGDGFNGCWGAYPWLPSGNIITTDIEGGLFIYSTNYVRGCYLEGTVTEVGTGAALGGTLVEILATQATDNTLIAGDYATGVATAGNYDVAFSKSGYVPDTAYNVALSNGVLVIQDMQLSPLPSFTFSGTVTDNGTGAAIDGALVNVFNSEWDFNTTTDANGNWSITPFYEGVFDITIGHWGHVTQCANNVTVDDLNATYDVALVTGYYDDFSLDFGWNVSGGAFTGIWERGEPEGTTSGGNPANPDVDIQGDCWDQAYVTGNGGGGAGNDDVDEFNTILTSPIFDITAVNNPFVAYERWFFNRGASANANDTLTIELSNGTNTVVFDQLLPTGNDVSTGWVSMSKRVSDYIAPTATMQLIVTTGDWTFSGNGGNIVEAAFDHFRVLPGELAVEDGELESGKMKAYPNPFNDAVVVDYVLTQPLASDAQLSIYDVQGREVYAQAITQEIGQISVGAALSTGIYVVLVQNGNEYLAPVKVTKTK